MEISDENKNILFKNTLLYLHDIADNVLDNHNILKSYYASKFHISQLQTRIFFEKNKKFDARCPKCCLKLRETDPSYVVKSEKKSKFAQKLLKKLESKKSLTKFQEKYSKKNDVKVGNKLVVTCNFCKNEIVHKFTKPSKIVSHTNDAALQSRNKKKKKKKDKFAGLQKEVVKSVQNKLKEVDKNRVLNNPISKKKERFKAKKALNKLNNILNRKDDNSQTNNLTLFLENVGNSNCQTKIEDEIIDVDKDENLDRVLNKTISKKKQRFKAKKALNKMNNNLTRKDNPQSNNLTLFLENVGNSNGQTNHKVEIIDLDKDETIGSDTMRILNNPISKKKTKLKKKKALNKLQNQTFFFDTIGCTQNLLKINKTPRKKNKLTNLQKGQNVNQNLPINGKSKSLSNSVSKNKRSKRKRAANKLGDVEKSKNGRQKNCLSSFLESFL